MLKSELLELIANGESSSVEFKRDDVRPEQVAREVVALINHRGGRILLGVDDDGTVVGIQRDDLEHWVMDTVFARFVHPWILPSYEAVELGDGVRVAVITMTQGTAKPYVLRHQDREEIYIRMGSTSRRATREQQARLFAIGGLLHTQTPRKTRELLELIQRRHDQKRGRVRQMVVFTRYSDTLRYLHAELTKRLRDCPVGTFSGAITTR